MPTDPGCQFDLFVSCAAADREWVQGFLLPELGLPKERVISNQPLESGATWFAPGAPITEEFQRAVTQSSFTLLVLSPAYFADVWAVHSAQMVAYLTVEKQRNRLIPLDKEKSKLPLDIQFRVRLDCTEEDWRTTAAMLRELLNQPEPNPERIACPYPGMEPFDETDSSRFFGRDREVQEMLQRLDTNPFMVVIGSSGCGKSSLVSAGLVPALRNSGLFGSGEWLVKHFRPGESPMDALTEVLGAEPVKGVPSLLASKPNTKRLLLVVDQFEELFTLAKQDQAPFQQLLVDLVQTEHCYVVLTVRADFYAYLMESPIWPQVQAHRLEVSPLAEQGIRQAIVRPATEVGVFVQGELVERLARDTSGQPGVLPFLQATLRLLWERLERRFLPLSAYERLAACRT